MKLVLLNGEEIGLKNDRCDHATWVSKYHEYANQIGFSSSLQINQNCDPIEILAKHYEENSFFDCGYKLIPVRSVLYIKK